METSSLFKASERFYVIHSQAVNNILLYLISI